MIYLLDVPCIILQCSIFVTYTAMFVILRGKITVCVLTALLVAGFPVGVSAADAYAPLTTHHIKTIIAEGVAWLLNAQEKNGHFKYEYSPFLGVYLDDDNIVRQAGAFYALGEVAIRDTENVFDLRPALVRSADFFIAQSKESMYADTPFRCIVSTPSSKVCKLGATSLALVGILDMVERYPADEKKYAPHIVAYRDFILAMHKDNGGFRNAYRINTKTQSDTESSFATGEALLALVRLYQYEEDSDVADAIHKTFAYIDSDAVPFDTALYLWATVALKDMQEIWPNDAHVAYVREYTEWRFNSVSDKKTTTHNMCAYIEGVVSAYSVVAPHVSAVEKKQYVDEIEYWLAKSSVLQVSSLTAENPMRKLLWTIVPARGGFLTGMFEPTQRIDFTQHCVSAYLQWLVDVQSVTL